MKVLRHTVAVRGVKVFAYHGCLPEESIIGSEFLVDVIINTDFSVAAAIDDLSKTIDYCLIFDIIQDQMKISSKLIEQVKLNELQYSFNSY